MALNPPSNVSAVAASQTSIRVSWSNPAQTIDTVLVWRADTAGGPWQNIADVTGTTFLDDGLPVNTTFFYRLSSQRRKRYSDFSAVVSATTGVSIPAVVETEAAPGALFSRQQIAFDGGAEAFIYQGLTGKQVRISGQPDTPFTLTYSGTLSNAYDNAKKKFVTMSLDSNVTHGQLNVLGGPSFTFGDNNARPEGLIKLKSGGFAGIYSIWGSAAIGIVYLSPTDVFSIQTVTFTEPSFIPPAGTAIAQHPVDDSIWGFITRDSTGLIRAVHLTEINNALRIDWTEREFLGHVDNNLIDDASPNGEFPHMEAFPDATRGVIQLAYQSAHQKIFTTSPFVKGTWITIAAIRPDRSKIFSFYQGWVERISGFGLVANPKGVFLAVNPLDEATLTFPKMQVVSMPTGTVLYTRPATRPISSLSGVDWLLDNEPTTRKIALT